MTEASSRFVRKGSVPSSLQILSIAFSRLVLPFAWLALYSLALFAVALVLGVMYTKTLGKRVDLIGQGSSEASGRSAPPSWTGVCALH